MTSHYYCPYFIYCLYITMGTIIAAIKAKTLSRTFYITHLTIIKNIKPTSHPYSHFSHHFMGNTTSSQHKKYLLYKVSGY